MKPIQYPDNTPNHYFEYHRTREGPNYFVSHYKDVARMHIDPKDAWRVLGAAKFTEQSKKLKQWCLDMHTEYGDDVKEGEVDTSFASAVESELNTRMIIWNGRQN